MTNGNLGHRVNLIFLDRDQNRVSIKSYFPIILEKSLELHDECIFLLLLFYVGVFHLCLLISK